MTDRWRAVAAALLNPDLRSRLAEAIGGLELSDARRQRATDRLLDIGLLRETPEGIAFDEQFVRDLLAEQPRNRPTGPQRFLDGDGRIDRYPVQAAERLDLLRWVARQAFAPGDVLSERATNERLARFTDDVAALRRYLVDAELLERTRSGSEYALVAGDEDESAASAP
ncbi:MAG: DUF2087 domain-containing protein [Microbacterium sp.]